MEIKPLGNRVLVLINKELKTKSGIILSAREESADEKPIKCEVLEVGEKVTEVKKGDKVIINKYCGSTVERVDEFVSKRIIDFKDILLVFKDE